MMLSNPDLWFVYKLYIFMISTTSFFQLNLLMFHISISTIYFFLGSPNITNSMLLKIKEKKQLAKQEQKKKIKKTKNDLKIINEMLKTDPQNLNLLLAKASMAAIIQDIETEIETLKKIIKINPITNVKSLLAQAYLRKNDGIVNELIKKLIDEVLFEKPKDPGANFILAKYLNQNGNKNKSRNLLLKILENLDDKGPWHQIYKNELNIK